MLTISQANRTKLIQDIFEDMGRLKRISQGSQTEMKDLGCSRAQMGVLFAVAHRGKQSGKQIAETLGVSTSAASQIIEPLVEKQFLSRTEDAKDRRVTHISLTTEGKAELRRIKGKFMAKVAVMMEPLSNDELVELQQLHRKMINHAMTHKEMAK